MCRTKKQMCRTKMRQIMAMIACAAAIVPSQITTARAASCDAGKMALGVSRIVEIDVSGGPLFGHITKYRNEPSFLKPNEVVLTFDDGPIPGITRPILETLEKFCTKATFFPVGKMAVAYPYMVKEVLARGHTIGSHTWSHPLHMNRMSLKKARDQIERGFSAISLAAGKPIAPFFRFPGLNDSQKMLNYLQGRHIGTFTVDVVSDDSFISDPDELVRVTLQRVKQKRGGIMLFHDIKKATAKALPKILAGLKKRGYKVVHIKPKNNFTNLAPYKAQMAAYGAMMRKRQNRANARAKIIKTTFVSQTLMPFYGAIGPGKFATLHIGPPVVSLAPPPRNRKVAVVRRKKRKPIYKKPASKDRPLRNEFGELLQ